MNLHKVLQYHGYESQLLCDTKNKKTIIKSADENQLSDYVLLTKNITKFKNTSQHCIYLNSNHRSPAYKQFNDLMKLIKQKVKAQEDVLEKINKDEN